VNFDRWQLKLTNASIARYNSAGDRNRSIGKISEWGGVEIGHPEEKGGICRYIYKFPGWGNHWVLNGDIGDR